MTWRDPKSGERRLNRGTEWFRLEGGRIAEVRAYHHGDARNPRGDLLGFDFAGRGYTIARTRTPSYGWTRFASSAPWRRSSAGEPRSAVAARLADLGGQLARTSPGSIVAELDLCPARRTAMSRPDSRRSSARTISLREPAADALDDRLDVRGRSVAASVPSSAISSAAVAGVDRADLLERDLAAASAAPAARRIPPRRRGLGGSSVALSAIRASTSTVSPSSGGVRWSPPRTSSETPGAETV